MILQLTGSIKIIRAGAQKRIFMWLSSLNKLLFISTTTQGIEWDWLILHHIYDNMLRNCDCFHGRNSNYEDSSSCCSSEIECNETAAVESSKLLNIILPKHWFRSWRRSRDHISMPKVERSKLTKIRINFQIFSHKSSACAWLCSIQADIQWQRIAPH